MQEEVIQSLPHKLTLIRTPIKDTRPKLSATGQKLGLKMISVHRSMKLTGSETKCHFTHSPGKPTAKLQDGVLIVNLL